MDPSRQADQAGGPARSDAYRPVCFLLLGLVLAARISVAQAPAVTIVDLSVATGHTIVLGANVSNAALPGSAIKPLVLWTALTHGVVRPQDRMLCRGTLRVAGHNLACTHPSNLRIFAASEALAYSCNTYFAQIGRQMPPTALQSGLEGFGLQISREADPDRRALLALGLAGQSVSALTLARAYARLAPHLHESSPAAETVRAGLEGSARYGMARAASTPGWLVLGKTGTVDDPKPPYQHGWFAAIASRTGAAEASERIIVVYAPGASGNEAALAAHTYLAGLGG